MRRLLFLALLNCSISLNAAVGQTDLLDHVPQPALQSAIRAEPDTVAVGDTLKVTISVINPGSESARASVPPDCAFGFGVRSADGAAIRVDWPCIWPAGTDRSTVLRPQATMETSFAVVVSAVALETVQPMAHALVIPAVGVLENAGERRPNPTVHWPIECGRVLSGTYLITGGVLPDVATDGERPPDSWAGVEVVVR